MEEVARELNGARVIDDALSLDNIDNAITWLAACGAHQLDTGELGVHNEGMGVRALPAPPWCFVKPYRLHPKRLKFYRSWPLVKHVCFDENDREAALYSAGVRFNTTEGANVILISEARLFPDGSRRPPKWRATVYDAGHWAWPTGDSAKFASQLSRDGRDGSELAQLAGYDAAIAESTLCYLAASCSLYHAEIEIDGSSVSIPGTREDFRAAASETARGRKALVHWVAQHARVRRSTGVRDVHVRAHVRGVDTFEAFGYRVTLRPPLAQEWRARGLVTEYHRALALSVAP